MGWSVILAGFCRLRQTNARYMYCQSFNTVFSLHLSTTVQLPTQHCPRYIRAILTLIPHPITNVTDR